MNTQLQINDQHADRIEYLERKVAELIDTVNVLIEHNNALADAAKAAYELWS